MEKLSRREKDTLCAIEEYMEENKYSPSVRELAEMLNSKSSSTVHRFLEGLKLKGFIDWEPSKPRTIRLRASE